MRLLKDRKQKRRPKDEFERKMLEYRKRYPAAEIDEEKLMLTVQRSKDVFYKSEKEYPLSYLEFVCQQMAYIRKSWWLLQIAVLVFLWQILYSSGNGLYWQRGAGVLAPLFVVILIPELWKNQRNASVEIEGAAYFSLRQVYSARMFLFAIVDIVILSLFFAVTSFTVQIALGEIVVQFFIPFNVTCCICLRTLCSRRLRSEYVSVALCLLWSAVWVQIILNNNIYEKISYPVWNGVVAISLAFLGLCAYKMLRSCEDYMEVNIIWN